jgi:alpha-glucoside transport system permease protein
VVFRFLYSTNPDIGVLNAIWTALGGEPISFLGRAELVNFAVIVAGVWIWTALSMTILSAAYRSIPQEVLEAASVDGSKPWQTFWRVSVPMMKGPIIVVAVTMIINAPKAVLAVPAALSASPCTGRSSTTIRPATGAQQP